MALLTRKRRRTYILEQNKAIARCEAEEIESKGNVAVADELMAPAYRLHFPGYPHGPRQFKQLIGGFHAGLPQLRITLEDQVAEGDRVVNRVSLRGTQTGSFQGMPPTGRSIAVSGINIMRISDGKIVEHWDVLDVMGLMQQLGAIPTPA